MAVGIAHILSIDFIKSPGHGVVWHDGGDAARRPVQFQGPFRKWLFMVFGVIARIDGEFAKGIVSVPSAFAGTAARPVLCHSADAVFAPAVSLPFGGL